MTPAVLTPGNFDGVHLGHQALVRAARERADAEGWRAVAMFFDPHPTAFFRPEAAPPLLTQPARRAELLRARGADAVDVRTFDAAFAAQSPEAFVEDVLVGEHRVRAIVCGPDFRFGAKRAGDVSVLRRLGEAHGFDVRVVDPVREAGGVVSSTRVRGLIGEGEVAAASALLDRYHDVTGVVVEGDRRGRTIGFPTANLAGPEDSPLGMVPADGVYAVIARADDGPPLRGVANIGVRPTFEAGRSLEVHLLDFEGDLYGRRLRVAFVARLRGERKFDGVDALVAQLGRDVEEGRAALDAADEGRLEWI